MSNGLSDAFYKSLLSTVSSDALTKLNFKYGDEYPKKARVHQRRSTKCNYQTFWLLLFCCYL